MHFYKQIITITLCSIVSVLFLVKLKANKNENIHACQKLSNIHFLFYKVGYKTKISGSTYCHSKFAAKWQHSALPLYYLPALTTTKHNKEK